MAPRVHAAVQNVTALREHAAYIWQDTLRGDWHPACSCGWEGPAMRDAGDDAPAEGEARKAARAHVHGPDNEPAALRHHTRLACGCWVDLSLLQLAIPCASHTPSPF